MPPDVLLYIYMKLLILKTTNPYYNLAVEEYLFSYSNEDVFMLWQNEPTVVIGKNQNVYAEINMDYLKENNIHIARRITGGGAVYHDLGNVNYTFISSKNNRCEINFEYYTKPIIEALQKLGIDAKLSGRNDLVVDEKKFSGSAQHAKGNRVLHHGTLLFNSNLDVLTNVLNVDEEKIKSKAIKSTRSRVTNLKDILNINLTSDEFISYISSYIIDCFSPEISNVPENQEIISLTNRNQSHDWLFPNNKLVSIYSTRKKIRYPFGIVDICAHMSNEIISDISISGDYFGVSDTKDLEKILKGSSISNIENLIKNIKIDDYILGMTNELFIEQIKKLY